MTRYFGLLTSTISEAGTLLPVTGDLYLVVASVASGSTLLSGTQTCLPLSLPVSSDSDLSSAVEESPRKKI